MCKLSTSLALIGGAILVGAPVITLAQDALIRQREQAIADVQSTVTESYEIDNIGQRRLLYGKPGQISYVVLLAGPVVVDYFTVDGKCTSSKKRLLPGEKLVAITNGTDGDGNYKYKGAALAVQSDDGTYGSSAEYIYCFTTDGRYVQWNGAYDVSDKPIELTMQPLVVVTP